MSSIKLIYFPVRGRAEPIRYILAQSGGKYEDVRVAKENWPQLKPTTPMGQVPVLEVDGQQICQSMAIARYLAKKFGLVPVNELDAARADMFVDGVSDLFPHIRPVFMAIMAGDEGKKTEAWNTFKTEQLPPFLEKYEAFLKKNGTGFLVGDKLSWADIVVAEILNRFVTIFDKPTLLSGHQNLIDLMNKVHELPNIKKYVDGRPQTPL